MYLIDPHCHLHDREFFSAPEAETMLENAHQNNVRQVVCIGTNVADSFTARDFSATHANVFWTFGVHPEFAADFVQSPDLLPSSQRSDTLVAIGEVGLDYHSDHFDRTQQIQLFEQMLDLATQLDLPCSFHIREAFDDFFPVVANFPHLRGVVHSFSDNKKNLRRVLETTDFYVGVNGLATYSTLPTPPLDRILIETDAPFLTPVPNRGKINEPAYIKDIAVWLSAKLSLPLEEVMEKTTNNGKQLFRLPDPQ